MPQYWAGIVNGKIDARELDTGFGGWGDHLTRMPALFTSKKQARREYEKVQKVEVKWGTTPRSRKRRART